MTASQPLPINEGRFMAIEGTIHTLNNQFDKLLDEIARSRGRIDFPHYTPAMTPPPPPPPPPPPGGGYPPPIPYGYPPRMMASPFSGEYQQHNAQSPSSAGYPPLSPFYFQAYEDRVSQLEESLGKFSLRSSKFEEELNNLSERHSEHAKRASLAHQRSVELEGLVHITSSRAENAEKKLGELEVMLEITKQQNQEFNQLLRISEAKCRATEMESQQLASRVAELDTELEAFQTKSINLEFVLQAANEKERDLMDTLNVVSEERSILDDMLNTSCEKRSQAEKWIEVLQIELKTTQEKLESAKKSLQISGVRENEILEKLIIAKNQLDCQGKATDHASTRCLELESLHVSLLEDSELKLQESVESLIQKDSEVKQLHEKVKYLEEQMIVYQDQAVAATEEVSLLKAELKTSATTLVFLETKVEELNRRVSETEIKIEQLYYENEILSGTNSEHKRELEEVLLKIQNMGSLLQETSSKTRPFESRNGILADNAGMDSVNLILELRVDHHKKCSNAGIDVITGTIGDMEKLGTLEAFKVKQAVLLSATKTAEMILRVDEKAYNSDCLKRLEEKLHFLPNEWVFVDISKLDYNSVTKSKEELIRKLINNQRFSFQNPKCTDQHVKTNALLQVHFSRHTVEGNLTADQREVLLSAHRLLQAMVVVLSSNGLLSLALLAIKVNQVVIQGMWEKDSMFLQCPCFSKKLAKRCQENYQAVVRSSLWRIAYFLMQLFKETTVVDMSTKSELWDPGGISWFADPLVQSREPGSVKYQFNYLDMNLSQFSNNSIGLIQSYQTRCQFITSRYSSFSISDNNSQSFSISDSRSQVSVIVAISHSSVLMINVHVWFVRKLKNSFLDKGASFHILVWDPGIKTTPLTLGQGQNKGRVLIRA